MHNNPAPVFVNVDLGFRINSHSESERFQEHGLEMPQCLHARAELRVQC